MEGIEHRGGMLQGHELAEPLVLTFQVVYNPEFDSWRNIEVLSANLARDAHDGRRDMRDSRGGDWFEPPDP